MSIPNASSLPAVSVLGIGAITPLGRKLDDIARLLEHPHSAPDKILRAGDILSDPAINRDMRRADRFGRMAVLAAMDAWNSTPLDARNVPPERVGIIVSSGFGPHWRGFRFLDGILDNGDKAASPTDFSHSVHGAAPAYISSILGIRGPSLPMTDFQIGFEQAVLLAQCWLSDGACDRVLIGAVEELGEVMLHCASKMLNGDKDFQPGEGAVFFMLAPSSVPGIGLSDASAKPNDVDLLIIEHPPAPWSVPLPSSIAAPHTVTFTSHFGYSAGSAAFDLLGGLLAIRSERPLGRSISGDSRQATSGNSIDKVSTFRTSSDGRATTLSITSARVGMG